MAVEVFGTGSNSFMQHLLKLYFGHNDTFIGLKKISNKVISKTI